MTSSTELVQQLQNQLHTESVSRRRQEMVNAKLQDEYDQLLKRLAQAELHIDRLRLGTSVDIAKKDGDPLPTSDNPYRHDDITTQRSTGLTTASLPASDNPYRHEDTTTQHIQGGTDMNTEPIPNQHHLVSSSPGLDTDGSHSSLRSPLQTSGSHPSLSTESLSTTDISQMSPTSVANRATAESIQMAHLFQIHNLQEQISALKEKVTSGIVSVGEVMAFLGKIQQEHHQLALDIESSSADLDALNQKYDGRASFHIARSQGVVGQELAGLAVKLRELEELLKTKNLLDSPPTVSHPCDETHTLSPTANMALSATEVHTRGSEWKEQSATEQDLSDDSLDSPIIPSQYLTESPMGHSLPDHTPLEASGSLLFAKQPWKEDIPQDVIQMGKARTPLHDGDTSSDLSSSFMSEQSSGEMGLAEQQPPDYLSSPTPEECLPPSHTQRGTKNEPWIPKSSHVKSDSLSVSSEQLSRGLSTVPHVPPHIPTQSPPAPHITENKPSLTRSHSHPNEHTYPLVPPTTQYPPTRSAHRTPLADRGQSSIAHLPELAIPGEADSGFAGSELPITLQTTDIAPTVASSVTSGEEEERRPSLTTAAIDTLRAELAELRQQILNSSRSHVPIPSSPYFHSSELPYPRNPLHTDRTPTQRERAFLTQREAVTLDPLETPLPPATSNHAQTSPSTTTEIPIPFRNPSAYTLTGHQRVKSATTPQPPNPLQPLVDPPPVYETGTNQLCAYTHSSDTETSSTVSVPSAADLSQWVCPKCGLGAMGTNGSPKQKHKHRHRQKRDKSAQALMENKGTRSFHPPRDREQDIRHGNPHPPLAETATSRSKRHVSQFSSESSGSEGDSSPQATPKHQPLRRPPFGLGHTRKDHLSPPTTPRCPSGLGHIHKYPLSPLATPRCPSGVGSPLATPRCPSGVGHTHKDHSSPLATPRCPSGVGHTHKDHSSLLATPRHQPFRRLPSVLGHTYNLSSPHTTPRRRSLAHPSGLDHTHKDSRDVSYRRPPMATSTPLHYHKHRDLLHTDTPLARPNCYPREEEYHTHVPESHTSPPVGYGHTSPPVRYGHTSPPVRYGHTSPPVRYGHTSPPVRYGHTSPPVRYGHTSPPVRYGHTSPPVRYGHTSPYHEVYTPRERARYMRVSHGEEVYYSEPSVSPRRRRRGVYTRPRSVKKLYLVDDHSSDSEIEVVGVSQNLGEVCNLARKLKRCTRKIHGELDRELESYRRRTTLY